eukprot:5698007-Pleurochrysis_carterae.AAC.1
MIAKGRRGAEITFVLVGAPHFHDGQAALDGKGGHVAKESKQLADGGLAALVAVVAPVESL